MASMFVRFTLCATLATFVSLANRSAHAAESAEFSKGLSLLQSKDAAGAVQAFKNALQEHPNDTAILTNLGIASFESGQKGWSVAFLRQALTEGSKLPETRRAFDFVMSQLDTKELPHDLVMWESFRSKVLFGTSVESLLFLLGLALLLSGLVFIRHLALRRRAHVNEEARPPFTWFHGVTLVLVVAAALLVWTKMMDLSQVRATIVADKTSAVTTPAADAPALFDLFAGLEVIVQRADKDFYQVQYPGGPTGWVPKNNLYITQSSQLVQ